MSKWVGNWFKQVEFECHCGCGRSSVHPKLLQLLDDVRAHLGCPLHINSGVRCVSHNTDIGGRPNSLHLPAGALKQGHAADITYSMTTNRNRVNILRLYVLLESYGRRTGSPIGIGLYDSFVHIDTRGELGMKAGRWSEGFNWQRIG